MRHRYDIPIKDQKTAEGNQKVFNTDKKKSLHRRQAVVGPGKMYLMKHIMNQNEITVTRQIVKAGGSVLGKAKKYAVLSMFHEISTPSYL